MVRLVSESAPMPRGCLFVLATLAALVPAQTLARQAAPPLSGYSLASWTERDGVPLGTVRAIVQDGHGYLWLGTSTGLLRFDGVRFATAAALGYTDMPTTGVRALLVAADSALWIGFTGGAGVRVIRGIRVETPGEPLRADVRALAQARDGVVWAATTGGVWRFDSGTWTRHPFKDKRAGAVLSLHIDQAGVVWAGTSQGLFRAAGDGFDRVGAFASGVNGITDDAAGHIWVTDPRSGFLTMGGNGSPSAAREGSGLEVFRDRRSNIWIGTAGQGVWRVRDADPAGEPEAATVLNGLLSNGIWAAFEDRENNIWLGSQLGITRLTPHSVMPVADIGVVRSVEADGNGVWAGTAGALLHVTRGGPHAPPRVTRIGVADVTALHRDAGGTLWVASSTGVAQMRGGRLIPLRLSPALTAVRSLAHTDADGLWIADDARGLYRLDRSGLTATELPPALASRAVRFIHGDREGRLWIAFSEGGLAYLDRQGRVTEADAEHGFAAGAHASLDAIAEDEHGAIWIGGTGGLTRYRDGRFTTINAESGLPDRRVTGISTDRSGHLWLAVEGGAVRIHSDEFDKAVIRPSHRMRHLRLDTSRGFGGVPVGSANERLTRTDEGGLWFATGWGLTFVDPTSPQLHEPATQLPALIEGALVNDAPVSPDDGRALPAGTNAVRIDYTAITLTTPTRVRFRYRLEGFDRDWVDAGTRRQAFYTNLPPGNYRFVVQAEAGDRSWTNPSDVWAFAIAPRFYQTATFYAMTLLVVALAAWGAWQMRLRHERRQFALVLGERARLSREIHDTLLQNLAGVAIQCAGISNSLDDRSPARAQLNGVRKQVEDYLRDMRQAVWDLRAPILETHGLADALREFGAQLTAGTAIRFDLSVSGRPRRFPAKIENDVLRVGQEGIRNAVRHSNGTQVRVELLFGRDELRLRVSDNGRGFDVSHHAADDRHFGVLGMRERAHELGGRLRIATPTAGGTDVELVVPAAANPQEA